VVLQSTLYSCGPCAVLNALTALGRAEPELTEQVMIRLAGCTPTFGSNATGLKRALSALRFKSRALSYAQPTRALGGLRRALKAGHPVIMLVDGDDHWVACVGALGDRFLLADSGGSGVVDSLSTEQLTRRWRGGGTRPTYYGIEVVL
jgi:predicted double-glycine peptidase